METIAEFVNLPTDVVSIIIQVVVIITILVAFHFFGGYLVSKVIRKLVRSSKHSSPEAELKRENTLIALIRPVLNATMWSIGAMVIISKLGINIAPLLAGASIVGIAIGFGSQELAKDFVSGFFIITENSFRIGDVVTIGGITGTVEDIDVRQVTIRNSGGKHFIPNGNIRLVSNLSMDFSKISLKFNVAYDSDFELIQKTIEKVGVDFANNPDYKDAIIDPPAYLGVDNFEMNGVRISISGKTKPGKHWSMTRAYRGELKKAFDQAGIKFATPQMVVQQIPPHK